MPDKSFELSIPFYQVATPTGTVSLPLVTVALVQASGTRVSLPLLFDTGASVTTLRDDLFPLLGVPSWDSGQRQQTQTAGGVAPVDVYRYDGTTLEVFGKTIICPIQLAQLPRNPLYVGLLGREILFAEFGFGFWENVRELYVASTP